MGLKNWELDQGWTLFLDRDGVVNERIFGGYVLKSTDFHYTPNALEALRLAHSMFNRIILVTNQQCVALDLISLPALQEIHQNMLTEIEANGGRIDAVFAAIELKKDPNNRRKPKPDMAFEAKKIFPEIDFSKSIMVGDTDGDLNFGKNLGMRTVLVESAENVTVTPDLVVGSLYEFILSLCE